MTETTCPSLAELGIKPGSFIRKLDKQTHWNAFADQEDLSMAALEVAARVFGEQGEIYSLWKVSTEQEFYGIVASLTATANPKDRNIDFIWISDHELEAAGVSLDNVPEGNCIRVKSLHFDVVITQQSAKHLCYELLSKQRIAYRCKKAQTKSILQYQRNLGCKAAAENSELCSCEAE
ncbi:MAG: hypothetical protein VKI82_04925 [Leptolyngbya sp.]|nr:hypothetical protein [Leptolyngbya sp.]